MQLAPCSWTVHVAVRGSSIERELILPPVPRRQSRSIKAESFLRLLDTLFQIMDPWGCGSTPNRSKFIKYTIVSLAILYFWGSNLVLA